MKSGIQNYKLTIEYDGSKYSGWQIQPKLKTIQGAILQAARDIFDSSSVEVYGAGRTDRGVHALEQIAHLKTYGKIHISLLRIKFNDLLPHDICIKKIETVPADFHARKSAIARSYIYQITTRPTAFGKNYSWWIKDKLDLRLMRNAAAQLIGEYDFAGLSERRDEKESTVVRVYDAELAEFGEQIIFRITASHFLWKMVRRIVYVLAGIGRGEFSENELEMILNKKKKPAGNASAPPAGLFLEKVYYHKSEMGDNPVRPLMNI